MPNYRKNIVVCLTILSIALLSGFFFEGFFRQITSPNVMVSQARLTELFEILLKLPNHFDHVDSFHTDNILGCVQSCLDHVRIIAFLSD